MFLSLSTTHHPATDLGFLLMKHPERVHEIELAFGKAFVFFPQASEARCEAALVLDIDPVGLVRRGDGVVDQYVNDRPYAASSFLSVALNKAFRTAMTGASRERPELAQTPLPLEIVVTPLPLRAQEELVLRLFEPLGWSVAMEHIEGRKGPSRYVRLTLRGTMRLADALSHLYVLIPALDRDKHYWVGDDEVHKLIAKAGVWFAAHPEREEIARRYLKNRRALVKAALERLVLEEAEADALEGAASAPVEEKLEAPLRLNDQRLDAVARVLGMSDAASMVDLGCGEGKLLALMLRHKRFTRIIGLDASSRTLEKAAQRLKLDRAGAPSPERLQLLHGALTYRDARWNDVDAAALVEVIEHLDSDRLPALADVVFGFAKPKLVVVTTPNVEHNVLFEGLAPGALRHADHRFEWTRAQFRDWAASIEQRYGYSARFEEIGESHPEHGAPTQMAVLTPRKAPDQ